MKPKERSLVKGAAFLAAAGIVIKILGLIFKIPLVYIIGEDGMGYFNSAYTIYNLFFMISNAGLPVAISILVSEEKARGDHGAIAFLFRTFLPAVALLGVLGCTLLWAGARALAALIGNPPADICIAVMAPVFLFVCVSGALRGYFQGMADMMPTGISQLLEALGKATLGIGFAMLGVKKGLSLPACAALSLCGIAVGAFLSMTYLACLALRKGAGRDAVAHSSRKAALKRLLRIAFPVTLGSLVLSLSGFMDLTLVMRGLCRMGLDADAANRLYGNYTALAVPMFNLPPVVIMPIAYATVPAVTKAKVKGDMAAIGEIAASSLKAASLITLPSVFGLSILSEPILSMLFEREAAQRASLPLSLLAPAVFFVGIVTVTGSILQAVGKQYLPVVSMLAGGAVKLAVSLISIPCIGIAGAPIGTLCCYAVIAILNLCFLVYHCHLHPGFMAKFWVPLAASFAACTVGKGISTLGDGRLCTLAALLVTAVLYVFLLLALGALKGEELAALPIPGFVKEKILKKGSKNENSQGTCKSADLRL